MAGTSPPSKRSKTGPSLAEPSLVQCDEGQPLYTHFLYFGTTVIYTIAQVSEVHKDSAIIVLENVVSDLNKIKIESFMRYVKEDLNKVKKILGQNLDKLFFGKVNELKDTYIFQYPRPPSSRKHEFSSISLSDLIDSGLKIIEDESVIVPPPQPNCHESHYALELFRRSSHLVNSYFNTLLISSISVDERAYIEYLMRIDEEFPAHSAEYVERTWTERLFRAMKSHAPHLQPKLTMFDASGGGFAKKILASWSGLNISANSVPYRGAPDITTNNKFIVVAAGVEDNLDVESDATDTSPIELNTGRKLNLTRGLSFCPEKTGELSAAMLTKGFCCILKTLQQGKKIKDHYIVHGSLLNKPESEVIQCEMVLSPNFVGSTRVSQQEIISPTKLTARVQPATTTLELCQSLHHFYSGPVGNTQNIVD